MEFNIDKEDLNNALSITVGGINPRATLPILGNILVETVGQDLVTFTSTDLEIGLCTKVKSRNVTEGSITVPARKFLDVIRELPSGEVLVTVNKNNAVNIKTGKTYCKLMGLGKEDFPKLPEFNLNDAVEIDQSIVKECLALTSFAISHDEARYVLNGVLIKASDKKIRFIATDGRRLAYVEKELSKPVKKSFEVIVPVKAVHELGKILKEDGVIKIVELQNQILFHLDSTYVITRLIEGRFPNYEQVIPKEESTIGAVDRQTFLSAVKRASLFTTQDAQAVKLDFMNGKVLVSAHSANLGEVKEELDASVNGDSISIGFNPHYLIDVLKIMEEAEVKISMSKSDKPGLIRGKDNYMYVIMPMQIA